MNFHVVMILLVVYLLAAGFILPKLDITKQVVNATAVKAIICILPIIYLWPIFAFLQYRTSRIK